ncbi:MAG: hypothetical protein L7U87_05140 [Chlamydiales bacterium]|nr:hypothetical protein [Chlamydiales bacterium]
MSNLETLNNLYTSCIHKLSDGLEKSEAFNMSCSVASLAALHCLEELKSDFESSTRIRYQK